jgi:hypothetical protein
MIQKRGVLNEELTVVSPAGDVQPLVERYAKSDKDPGRGEALASLTLARTHLSIVILQDLEVDQ